jgi:riboflavin kinase/FMN adenylyltransferase
MTINTVCWNESVPPRCQQGAVTIGNFDGVHRGHLALLAEAHRQSRVLEGPTLAVTFEPHPLQLLRPEQFQPVLTTALDRAGLLQAAGADHVFIVKTTLDFLKLSAAEFFSQVIRQGFAARCLVEGPNFGFGRNREGNVSLLEKWCADAGMMFTMVPPVTWHGQAISSSRVRDALVHGRPRDAIELLNRPYRLSGLVVAGKSRGQTLGFPTANLENVATLVPGNGVYAVRVTHEGRTWPGAANLGPNPTFGENVRKIEVHLIGFQGNLKGKVIEVDFIDRLRDTKAFSGPAELVAQLKEDVASASQIIASWEATGTNS